MLSTKQIKLKHGISELGNLQVYRVTEYLKDGKVVSSKMDKPYTPADVNNMEGFDQKSKDLVSAINTPKVKADFETEKQIITGIGAEEIVTYDRIPEDDGKIAIRKITRIFDDGVEKSKKFHRSWIMPGDNPEGNDVISKALAKKLHTQEVIDNYKTKLKEQANKQI